MLRNQRLSIVMNMPKHNELIIDPDVAALFLPTDYNHLRVIRENIRLGIAPSPFPEWNGILMDRLDEYNEYVNAGVEIKTQPFLFSSKNTMLAGICQLIAADIPKMTPYKIYLIGKQYQYHKAAYLNKELDCPDKRLSLEELKEKYTKDIHPSVVEMVDLYNVAAGTIHFYSRYAAAIDLIREKNSGFASLILSERIHIPKKELVRMCDLSASELEELMARIEAEHLQRITLSMIPGHVPVYIEREKPHLDNRILPEIKQMPKYDPDADVSSLALTVPSWSDSIRRVRTRTDMSAVTPGAADRLIFELGILENNIHIIKHELEEIAKDVE